MFINMECGPRPADGTVYKDHMASERYVPVWHSNNQIVAHFIRNPFECLPTVRVPCMNVAFISNLVGQESAGFVKFLDKAPGKMHKN